MHTIADVVEVMDYSAPNTIRLNCDVSRNDLIEFATGEEFVRLSSFNSLSRQLLQRRQ
jgi:hypothetical protein